MSINQCLVSYTPCSAVTATASITQLVNILNGQWLGHAHHGTQQAYVGHSGARSLKLYRPNLVRNFDAALPTSAYFDQGSIRDHFTIVYSPQSWFIH